MSTLIDKLHVRGSPTTIQLSSVVPDLPLTKVSGEGLSALIAGERGKLVLRFFDEYDNAVMCMINHVAEAFDHTTFKE